MSARWKRIVPLVALAGFWTFPCPGQSNAVTADDPKYSYYRDPPPFYVTTAADTQLKLFLVSSNPYSTAYTLVPDIVIPVTAPPQPSGMGLSALPEDPVIIPGSPTDKPDPDEDGPDPHDDDSPPETPSNDSDPSLGPPQGDGDPRTPNDPGFLPGQQPGVFSFDFNGNTITITVVSSPSGGRNAAAGPALTVLATIKVGLNPAGLALTPDRTQLFVSNFGSGTVSVIDLNSRAVVSTIQLPFQAKPAAIAITPDGKTAYVANFIGKAAALFVVDIASRTVVATIPVGPFPAAVKITPDGTQAWVTSYSESSVSIIDVLTNKQVGRQAPIFQAWGLAFNRTGTRAYVSSSTVGNGTVVVMDTMTYKILATILVGPQPKALRVSPTGRHVFVAISGADYVTQIDALTNTAIRNITVGLNPTSIQWFRNTLVKGATP